MAWPGPNRSDTAVVAKQAKAPQPPPQHDKPNHAQLTTMVQAQRPITKQFGQCIQTLGRTMRTRHSIVFQSSRNTAIIVNSSVGSLMPTTQVLSDQIFVNQTCDGDGLTATPHAHAHGVHGTTIATGTTQTHSSTSKHDPSDDHLQHTHDARTASAWLKRQSRQRGSAMATPHHSSAATKTRSPRCACTLLWYTGQRATTFGGHY